MRPSNPKSFSLPRLLFATLFVAALLSPALLGLVGSDNAAGKLKQKIEWPGLQTDALFDADYYKAWVQYAQGRLTAAGPLFKAKNWIDYRVFSMTETDGVHVGRSGWLFDEESVRDFRKAGCPEAPAIQRLTLALRATEKIIESAGRRFIVTVAPNKSTIYPEYVGSVPQEDACGSSPYDLLVAALEKDPLEAFVRLDTILTEAKAAQRLLYSQTGTYWNADGARVAAHMLIKRLVGPPMIETMEDAGDLASTILQPSTAMPGGEHRSVRQRSSAVIYGGQTLNRLLPYLQPSFERIDVIASTSLPSNVHDENLSAYDTIILVLSETQLSKQQINLDRMGRSLDAETMADAEQPLSLDDITAGNQVAINREAGHLLIKSMGAEAYCTLPPFAGSDSGRQRLLMLDLTAPLSDTLRWSIADNALFGGGHTLRAGSNRLYLPLPRGPQLRIHLHPGQNAGIFKLQTATLLTFGDVPAPAAKSDHSLDDRGMQEGAAQTDDLPAYEVPPPQQAISRIQLNDFEFKQVFQRRGTASDVLIAGVYQGAPGAIEARVLHYESDEVIMPWTVVDPEPDNGIFMGTLPGVPQGGWYRLAVRFSDRPEVAAWGVSPWGVGMLVACIGQSNMKEWFHTGDPSDPHPLLSIHRGGRWTPVESIGNGATAFGHRLISTLNIPVGLLDYAVNGSGLHPKANWGTGHWADRSQNSIYQRFIDSATAAGSVMEYVIWMQGEADAARKTISEYQYLQAIESFITRQVRKDIDNGSHRANLPFLVVGMVKRPVGADEPHQAIRNALVSATREIADTYLAATTLDLKLQGRQHLAPEAYTALGQRVAQTILFLLGKAEYYRGPAMAHIEKIDDITLDLYMNHRGGNDFSPQTNITGFEAFSNDIPLTIKGIDRQNDHRIRIQLQQPAEGELRLTYLYGARPDTSGAVHDNTHLRLPMEPFEAKVDGGGPSKLIWPATDGRPDIDLKKSLPDSGETWIQ